jgi:hypothetical protein
MTCRFAAATHDSCDRPRTKVTEISELPQQVETVLFEIGKGFGQRLLLSVRTLYVQTKRPKKGDALFQHFYVAHPDEPPPFTIHRIECILI